MQKIHEVKEKEPSKAFELNDVPEEVMGVKLNESTRRMIADGKESHLIEGMLVNDGQELRNAKIRLVKGKDGKAELAFSFQNEQLIIPEKIADYKLTEEDKTKLVNGETAGPVRIKGSEVYLQVDKDLNSVTVKSARDISVKDVIQLKSEKGKFVVAGYVPSKKEVEDLLNGKTIPTKVYEQDGKYFAARLSITDDDKGVRFTEISSLTPERAKELKERLNVQRDDASLTVENVTKTGSEVVKAEGIDRNLEVVRPEGVERKMDNVGVVVEGAQNLLEQNPEKIKELQDKEFISAVERKDFVKLNQLNEQGYKPSDQMVKNADNLPGVKAEDKVAVKAVFGIESSTEVGKGEKNKLEQEKNKGIKITPEKHEKGNEKKGDIVKQAIDKLSQDM